MTGQTDAKSKPVILTFVRTYLPGYKSGGPIRSISNMVEALGDEFQFRIVTTDRDSGDDRPYAVARTPSDWVQIGKATVLYLSPPARGIRNICQILRSTPYDVLYLNSFFSPDFTIKPLIARKLLGQRHKPCVVAPRGEFSAGALALKSWKKSSFIAMMPALRLYDGVTWQASAEYDARDIQSALRVDTRDIRIAIDISTSPPTSGERTLEHHLRQAGTPLRLCFLSRIVPIKNLDFALQVLQRTPIPVHFRIFGPVEDRSFWLRCRELMTSLPPHVEAVFEGSIEHGSVARAFSDSDLFFFPTLGENYGHVIGEALSVGTPVLISDRTPWRDLEAAGVGWDIPLEAGPDAFVEKILEADRVTRHDGANWRRRAEAFAIDRRRYRDGLQATRRLLSF